MTNGTGSGDYLPGTVVSIRANDPAVGQVFDKWTGDTANIANINLPNTTIHIPSAALTVTAAYINNITPEPPAAGGYLQVPFPMGWVRAHWRVDGENWLSGTFGVSVTPGVHTVAFESVPGWTTPQPLNVDIIDGQTTFVTVDADRFFG